VTGLQPNQPPWGKGCFRCHRGYPITYIVSPAGELALCYDCTMWWFPGRGADWFELHHAPLRDHFAVRRRAAAAFAMARSHQIPMAISA